MTGSPFARTKNHSGCASNTGFCVLLRSKRPITRILSRVRLAHDVAEQIAAGREGTCWDSETARASDTARRCLPCSSETCSRRSLATAATSSRGIDGRIRLAQVGLEKADRLALPPGRSIHGPGGR